MNRVIVMIETADNAAFNDIIRFILGLKGIASRKEIQVSHEITGLNEEIILDDDDEPF